MNWQNLKGFMDQALTGLETGVATVVLSVIAIFIPQLANLSVHALTTIATNFQNFISEVEGGRPVGEALSGMLTADWGELEEDARMAGTDFIEAVVISLQKVGILPKDGSTSA